ncbi:LOW QUALITY PROTEIN: protein hunchback-like [Rhipicephalus sanguineus]|uniref:LOW QUALITY PROTEIN: protein hunchback-like n=1 Tax=Rhipicephalus sanguineus TaxID=34632 RepID=UPI0020C35AEB|nr:LOW QUALITY PROTEIN: protein hunchback-like [Rhipicephalus sanguineus]
MADDPRCVVAEEGGRDRSDASCGEDSDSDSALNPLAQLQSALQKTGALGSALEGSVEGSPTGPGQPTSDDAGAGDAPSPYRCHMCAFQGRSKAEYGGHMATHLDHKCPMCDYRSRTEGRLKRHVKDFHSDDQWQILPGADDCKDRTFRCRQCGHVAASKTDFWEHSKLHIRTEKLLSCPKCPFVTEYKHHLEYHLRNHFGSKPFKCPKCNYSCVNKSMLNSHLKSHSNVYQYRCADCNYATKYCHSLKLHLRKYAHRPAGVLNSDGSPDLYPMLDVYGARRGPRRGPRGYPPIPVPPPPPPPPPLQETTAPPPDLNVQGQPLVSLIPAVACAQQQQQQLLRAAALAAPGTVPWKCSVCDFTTADEQQLSRHVLGHAESQDLCRLYGIRSLPGVAPPMPPPPPPPPPLPPTTTIATHQQQPQLEAQPERPAVVSSTSSHETPPRDERKGSPLDLSRTLAEMPRSRRKGRATKIDKLCMRLQQDDASPPEIKKSPAPAEPPSPASPVQAPSPSALATSPRREVSSDQPADVGNKPQKDSFRCAYCDIAFEHCIMYTVHMGYHGYHDPFTCNMCGQRSEDKLAFFLHIARAAHL